MLKRKTAIVTGGTRGIGFSKDTKNITILSAGIPLIIAGSPSLSSSSIFK